MIINITELRSEPNASDMAYYSEGFLGAYWPVKPYTPYHQAYVYAAYYNGLRVTAGHGRLAEAIKAVWAIKWSMQEAEAQGL